MVVVTPSAGRSFYMDYKDGSQKWESFIVGPFLEHLRQTLWDFKIPHEYHLVRGADHVGRTIRLRTTEALGVLARVLNPSAADAEADALRRQLEPLKRAAEKKP